MANRPTTFRVASGLPSAEHKRRIGAAIWTFLYLLDRQTSADGYVLHGRPITSRDIAADIGAPERTVRRDLARLAREGYVDIVATDTRGSAIRILNQKKFGDGGAGPASASHARRNEVRTAIHDARKRSSPKPVNSGREDAVNSGREAVTSGREPAKSDRQVMRNNRNTGTQEGTTRARARDSFTARRSDEEGPPTDPRLIDTDPEQTTVDQGRTAHATGAAVDACPYDRQSADVTEQLRARDWSIGWQSAYLEAAASA